MRSFLSRRPSVFRPGLVIAVLGVLLVAQLAIATHPRPRGATPLRVSLLPSFKECTAPNSTHGPPLAFPSCVPPAQTSNYLTVGTPDANGAAPNSVGAVKLRVTGSVPSGVITSGSITDVRCLPATDAAVCTGTNAAGGPDYSGDLEGNATARATDHFNGPNHDQPGTVQDVPNPFVFHCFNTADTSVGGVCRVDESQPLIPGPYWWEGQRVVIELTQLEVSDGGPDGNAFTKDNTRFAVQGVFLP
jgi:hypothetical protein